MATVACSGGGGDDAGPSPRPSGDTAAPVEDTGPVDTGSPDDTGTLPPPVSGIRLSDDFESGAIDPTVWSSQGPSVAYEDDYVHRGRYSLRLDAQATAETVAVDASRCTEVHWWLDVKRGPQVPDGDLRLERWDGSAWATIETIGVGEDALFVPVTGSSGEAGMLHGDLRLRLASDAVSGSYYVDDLVLACNPDPTDTDGDGFGETLDCDPDDPQHFEDCGACIDLDLDGYGIECDPGPDCNDQDPSIFPGATDVSGDDVDANCDGFDTPHFLFDNFDGGGPDPAVWADVSASVEPSVLGRGRSVRLANGGSLRSVPIDTSSCDAVVIRARVRRDPGSPTAGQYVRLEYETSTTGISIADTILADQTSDSEFTEFVTLLDFGAARGSGFRVLVRNLFSTTAFLVDDLAAGCAGPDTDGDERPFSIDCAPADPDHWSDCGRCLDADGDSYGEDCDLGEDCDEADIDSYDGAFDPFGDGADTNCDGFDGRGFFDDFESGAFDPEVYAPFPRGFAVREEQAYSGTFSAVADTEVFSSASLTPPSADLSECPAVVWFYRSRRSAAVPWNLGLRFTYVDGTSSVVADERFGNGRGDDRYEYRWGVVDDPAVLANWRPSFNYSPDPIPLYLDDVGWACFDPDDPEDGDGVPDAIDCAIGDVEHWSDCGYCVDPDGDGRGDKCDLGPDCDEGDATIHAGAPDPYGDGVDGNCDGVDGIDFTDGFEAEGPSADDWAEIEGFVDGTADHAATGDWGLKLTEDQVVTTRSIDTRDCGEIVWSFSAYRDFPVPDVGDDLVVSWFDGSRFVELTRFEGDGGQDQAFTRRWGVLDDPAALRPDFALRFEVQQLESTSDEDDFVIDDVVVRCTDSAVDDGDGVPDSIDCDPQDDRHWFDCDTCVDVDDDGYGVGCDLGEDCDDFDPALSPGALDVYGDDLDVNCDGFDGAGFFDDFEDFTLPDWARVDRSDVFASPSRAFSGNRALEFEGEGFAETESVDLTSCSDVYWFYRYSPDRFTDEVGLVASWWNGSEWVEADFVRGRDTSDTSWERRYGRIADPAARRSDFAMRLERVQNTPTSEELRVDDFGFACGDVGNDGDGIPTPIDCDPTSGAHWFDCGICIDADGDDHGAGCDLGPDCNDGDGAIAPGLPDVQGDAIDSDCSGRDGLAQGTGFETGGLAPPLASLFGGVSFESTNVHLGSFAMAFEGVGQATSLPFDASSCADGVAYSYYVGPREGTVFFEVYNGTTWQIEEVHPDTGGSEPFTWTVGVTKGVSIPDLRWRFRHEPRFASSRAYVDEVFVGCADDPDDDGVPTFLDCAPTDGRHWADCGGACNDGDGDDHGEGCDLGPDCDDTDDLVSPTAPDPVGDNIDTDCNGIDGPGIVDTFAGTSLDPARWEWIFGTVSFQQPGLSTFSSGTLQSVPFDTSGCAELVWSVTADVDPDGGTGQGMALQWWNGVEFVTERSWDLSRYQPERSERWWGAITDPAAFSPDFQFRVDLIDGRISLDEVRVVCSVPDSDGDEVPDAIDCAPSDSLHWFDCGDCADGDGDGYGEACDLGLDCDEADPLRNPGAADPYGDGVDTDCSFADGEAIVEDFATGEPDRSRWDHAAMAGDLRSSFEGGLLLSAGSRLVTRTMDTSTCTEIVWKFALERRSFGSDVEVVWSDGASSTLAEFIPDEEEYGTRVYDGAITDPAAFGPDFSFEIAVSKPWFDYPIEFGIDTIALGCTGPDGDGDGILALPDCDDADPAHWYDCGQCIDDDMDDHGENCDLGFDCDDTDDQRYSSALDLPGDGLDSDCSLVDGPGLWDDLDAAFESVTSTSGEFNLVTLGGGNVGAQMFGGARFSFASIDLGDCTEATWHLRVRQGDTGIAPFSFEELVLEAYDGNAWREVVRLPGTEVVTPFVEHTGPLAPSLLEVQQLDFRLTNDSFTDDRDFVVDHVAVGCDDDLDQLATIYEYWSIGTNFGVPDSDGDGVLDGVEVINGTDPQNPFSF